MQATYEEMVAAWARLQTQTESRRLGEWSEAFERIARRQAELVAAGQWVSGPSDTMHLLRVNDLELMHSRMVGWLLTPTGRHRLGGRILASILQAGWPGQPVLAASRAVVRLEVAMSATRADIVAYMPEGILVIENKVWASEDVAQCESLYEDWAGSHSDVRFLLLTRDGLPPTSTRTQAVADEWRNLSYRSFATLLADVLGTGPRVRSAGRSAVEQYLATLDGMGLSGLPFEVQIGGGHVDA
jgi:hypothetical protein